MITDHFGKTIVFNVVVSWTTRT